MGLTVAHIWAREDHNSNFSKLIRDQEDDRELVLPFNFGSAQKTGLPNTRFTLVTVSDIVPDGLLNIWSRPPALIYSAHIR